jgi:hypothetical protein
MPRRATSNRVAEIPSGARGVAIGVTSDDQAVPGEVSSEITKAQVQPEDLRVPERHDCGRQLPGSRPSPS